MPEGSKLRPDGTQKDYLEYLIEEAKAAGLPTHQAIEVDTNKNDYWSTPAPDGSFNKVQHLTLQ